MLMKTNLVALSALTGALAVVPASAIETGPLGSHGEGGSRNGQTFRIGSVGSVFELDAFVAVGGTDLNGADAGRAAKLSRHDLPAGLNLAFANELSADKTDLTLRYTFTNTTNAPFNDLRLYVFLDVEIAEAQNTFFNEQAEISGASGVGPGDASPDFWQIDEPGFAGGTLYKNLLDAGLSNRNAFPEGPAEDIAMAIGFSLGTLKPGETVTARTMISEDGSTLGPMALIQTDPAVTPPTRVTFSGAADPREQVVNDLTGLVQLSFEWRLNPPVGSLLGHLRIQNTSDSQISLGPPFQLGLQSTAGRRFVRPTGTLDNGVPYLDITDKVMSQLGAATTLLPGQAVTIDGVEVYTAGRLAPPSNVWSLWGTRLAAPSPGN